MKTVNTILLVIFLISSNLNATIADEKVCYKLNGAKKDIERLIKADLLTKYTLIESIEGAEQLTLSTNRSHIIKTEVAIVDQPVTFLFSYNKETNIYCGWIN